MLNLKDIILKDNMNKEILKQDVVDLEFLIRKYIKENNYEKATECKKELERIKNQLKGKC